MVWMTLSSVGVRVQAHLSPLIFFSGHDDDDNQLHIIHTLFLLYLLSLPLSLFKKDGAGRGRVAEDAAEDRRGGRGVPVRLRCFDVM